MTDPEPTVEANDGDDDTATADDDSSTMTETDATTDTEDAPEDSDPTDVAVPTADGSSSGDGDEATGGTADGDGSTAPTAGSDRDVVRYLYWGALVVLGLLAATALLRFYSSAGSAIATWIAPRFEPVVQAAFNLVVLLLAAIGISLVVRELRG